MEGIKYLIIVFMLIGLVSASYCPNGIYPCDNNLPFITSKQIISSSSGSCTCNTFFNSTYDKYAYNQTTSSTGNYNYNETQEANKSIFNVYNSQWSSTYNITYHNLISLVYNYSNINNPLIINYTLISNPLIINYTLINNPLIINYTLINSSFNINQTDNAIESFASWGVNGTTLSISNITNFLNNYNFTDPTRTYILGLGNTFTSGNVFSTNKYNSFTNVTINNLLNFTARTVPTCNSVSNGSLTRAPNGSLLYCRFGNGVWYVAGGVG